MARRTLRSEILLSTSVLLVSLLGLTLLLINFQAQGIVNETITANLEQRRKAIEQARAERIADLQLTAQLVASFPSLKDLLSRTDQITIQDFLRDYLGTNQRADLLIVLDPTGKVLARSDADPPAPLLDVARWMGPALNTPEQAAAGVLREEQNTYDAVAVPSAASGTVFGFVIAGARIDDAFAQRLAGSGERVVIAGERVLGSTIERSQLPWQSRADWNAMARLAGQHQNLTLAGESYLALPFALAQGDTPLLAVILQSRDIALAPYRRIQLGLGILGLAAFGVGITVASFQSRNMASGMLKLTEGTERVARGDFGTPIEVQPKDVAEIVALAGSYNEMIKGLREREAIGKFVSQSTISMIQADTHKMAAGGQRVELTVFFSDIRGFTELSEKRAPEDVVKILNHCLSLQANIIQKYRGDVDKYVGDCVVAHFYDASSAADAIQCSIEIEKALEKCNAALHMHERIEVGIGITTGEVVLGSIGSDDRRDFTAIGSNVNLASRLCSLAGPGEILLAEATYDRVKEQVPAERLEPLSVKGFSRPIPVYRIAVGKAVASD